MTLSQLADLLNVPVFTLAMHQGTKARYHAYYVRRLPIAVILDIIFHFANKPFATPEAQNVRRRIAEGSIRFTTKGDVIYNG